MNLCNSMRCLFFAFLLLCGCSQNDLRTKSSLDHFMADNGKLKILSTTGIINDMVGQIGGEYIDHLALINGELDPHSYELVKGDNEKIHFAKIVFYNGLGLEHGASLHYALEHHPKAISLGSEIIKQYPQSAVNVDAVVDPHIWMDISLWMATIDPIVDALSAMDAQHASVFKENGEVLREKMRKTDEKICTLMEQIPLEKRYLVTSHDAFNYFTKRYLSNGEEKWKMRFAAPEGLSPEGQLSTAHISEIVNYLVQHQVHVVFPESNVSRDSLKKIVTACREKGMDVKISQEVLYGDALGVQGSGSETYLQMMEHNAEVLFKEWQ